MFITDTSLSFVTVQSLSSYVIDDDVSIVCTISLTNAIGPDVSSLVVNWFKNNEMITDNIIINGSLSTFNSILTLTQVSPTDAGVYTCNASINGSNIVLSDSKPLCLKGIYINICDSLMFFIDLVLFNQNTNSFTNLPLGYSATIQCVNPSSFNGIAIRSIEWTDSDGTIISNTNTLILPNVVPSINNTKYTCTADVDTNPGSCLPESKTITIDTKSIAYVKLMSFLFSLYLETYVNSTFIPFRFSFLINSSVNIECIIILNTPVGPGIQPNVTWYHNMTDITHYSSLRRDHNNLFTSILTIDSIQVSDAGVYHCNAGIHSNVTTNNISVCVTGNASDNSVFAINILLFS